ncbi:MAG: nucleotidyltransferase domain-containing protein [Candidatus Falkowbacteria bacterium]|nr:nucleotidyltransferase domain-containing protein [Candidatus Falkowbacteria bacterium]
METALTRSKAKLLAKTYANVLQDGKFQFEEIYLFGSYAKNNFKKWSDVDIAVVSNRLKRNWEKNIILLRRFSRSVDERIEPLGFTSIDFKDKNNPLVSEILKTGIKII